MTFDDKINTYVYFRNSLKKGEKPTQKNILKAVNKIKLDTFCLDEKATKKELFEFLLWFCDVEPEGEQIV